MNRPGRERRRFPRVRLLRPFVGQTLAVRHLFRLHDLSLGGFSVESPIPFVEGAVHPFAFSADNRALVVLSGTVRHCLRASRPDTSPYYLVGFEFVHSESHDANLIADMLKNGAASASPREAVTT